MQYSAEDRCLVGRVVGVQDRIGFQGDCEEAMEEAFREAVEDYLYLCQKLKREPNKPTC